jgi:hypothetical protein
VEDEIARVCGVVNAATGRLVRLIPQVLQTEASAGRRHRSAEQWVAWRWGVSSGRARRLVARAGRLDELPGVRAGLHRRGDGPPGLRCHRGPAAPDRVGLFLRRHPRGVAGRGRTPAGGLRPHRHRVVALSAVLTSDQGALVEQALAAARDVLFPAGEHEPGAGPSAGDVS